MPGDFVEFQLHSTARAQGGRRACFEGIRHLPDRGATGDDRKVRIYRRRQFPIKSVECQLDLLL